MRFEGAVEVVRDCGLPRHARSFIALAFLTAFNASAQQGGVPESQPGERGSQPPVIISPEVQSDGHVTFRLNAPGAQSVKLAGNDIPGNEQGALMTKAESGVWQVTLGPLEPGAYRYNFNVDRLPVIDPRNPAISESNNNVWSLVYVPGADFMDTKDVPHGAVASVNYYSKTLSKPRRMHVYTPPGYELGQGVFPVLYLLHGGNDCDESWTSVGRAGFILDNLIAAKKAKPMLVVMPAGQTSQIPGAGKMEDFVGDFLNDIMPYVEMHYRVRNDRAHRAIAGLSLGGLQTLNISIPHVDKFGYIGVYSSGLVAVVPGRGPVGGAAPVAEWEKQHQAELDNTAAKKGLRLLWFRTGVDDKTITPATTRATVDMLNKHAFSAVFQESSGAHTWTNWRNYLNEFAPLLFQ